MEETERLKSILRTNEQQLPFSIDETVSIRPLGRGESNDNYLISQGLNKLVLRVAKGRRNRLDKEFNTLKILPISVGPKAYFYSDTESLYVLAEEYIPGEHLLEWTDAKIELLVKTVSKVHKITADTADIRTEKTRTISLNKYIEIINGPFIKNVDSSLVNPVGHSIRNFCNRHQALFNNLNKYSLIHADLAPVNSLYNSEENSIRLIDWEFAQFFDPARDFATFFYNGIDYNQGKWRVSFDRRQQELLVAYYKSQTGEDIGERLKVWLELDKYNSLVWLNWKLHNYNKSDRRTLTKNEIQNEIDKLLKALIIN